VPIAQTKDNLPLSEYLVQRRRFLKINLTDLISKTKIQPKYIKKIESGDWLGLPAGAYTKGFLRKYAGIVELDSEEVCLRYEKELALMKNAPANIKSKKNSAGKILNRIDFFKNVSLWKITVVIFVAMVLSYISWQVYVILENPSLNVTAPREDISVDNPVFMVEGAVSVGNALSINNQEVYSGENGLFKKEIELLPGLNVLEIKTVSRFGKETKITRKITYQPKEEQNNGQEKR